MTYPGKPVPLQGVRCFLVGDMPGAVKVNRSTLIVELPVLPSKPGGRRAVVTAFVPGRFMPAPVLVSSRRPLKVVDPSQAGPYGPAPSRPRPRSLSDPSLVSQLCPLGPCREPLQLFRPARSFEHVCQQNRFVLNRTWGPVRPAGWFCTSSGSRLEQVGKEVRGKRP